MKKKLIGLSTLLLALLLGLFTISYADTGVTLTDIKNYCYNIGISQSKIDSLDWSQFELDLLSSNHIVLNDNSGAWIYLIKGSYNNNYIYTNSGNYNSGNGLYSSNGNSNCVLYRVGNSNNTVFTVSWSQTSTITNKFYTNVAFRGRWSNSWHDITGYTMPYMRPTNLFDGPYQDSAPFSFVPKPADVTADVYYFEDVPLYNASGEDLYIGQLFEPVGTNVVYWTKDNYYYRFGDWNMRQLPVDSIYLQYFTTENDVAVYDVYLQSKYIYENTIYSSVWADGSTEPYTLAIGNFYIKNNYTQVVNGVIDPNSTFSGDYKDNYDNDIENQEDVDNISQAINDTINTPVDVSGELAQYFSGDMYDIAESFGFDSTVSIYFTFIEDFLKNVCNVLLDNNDVYFDYSMHGENATRIYASDINLPNGHPLKVFISIILVFLTVYLLYFQFMKLFEYLQTADLSKAIKSQDVSFYIFKM